MRFNVAGMYYEDIFNLMDKIDALYRKRGLPNPTYSLQLPLRFTVPIHPDDEAQLREEYPDVTDN